MQGPEMLRGSSEIMPLLSSPFLDVVKQQHMYRLKSLFRFPFEGSELLITRTKYNKFYVDVRPPLWSSGQSS
jgi:hypothetical protein